MKFVAGLIVGAAAGFAWALLTEPTPESAELSHERRMAARAWKAAEEGRLADIEPLH